MNRNNWHLRLSLCIAITSAFITPAQAALTILPGDTYINDVPLDNIDLIFNQGTFENNSILNNLDFSTFNNQGSAINTAEMIFLNQSALLNYGSFENIGRMFFYETARFENYSNFVNSGLIETQTLNNQSTGVFTNDIGGSIILNRDSSINNAGIFNHNGDISTGIPVALFTNTLNNAGVFNNNGTFTLPFNEFILNNSGTFNNYTDLNFSAENSEIVNSGTFENNARVSVRGSITNTATGIFNNLAGSSIEVAGVFDNQGVFNNDAELRINERFDFVTGTTTAAELNNSGVFNLTFGLSSAGLQGLNINNSGEFNNNNAISSEGRISINNAGVFNNNTLIDMRGFGTAGPSEARLLNSGTFNNDLGSVFGVAYLDNSGVFENANGSVDVIGHLLNNTTGVFNNGLGGSARVVGVLENRGEFNNQSTLLLQEDFLTVDPLTGLPVAAQLNNSGVFNHAGDILVFGAAGLNIINSGTFNNNGFTDSIERTVINNSGVFNNNVLLEMNGINPLGDEINNSGTFNNNQGIIGTGRLSNTGNFENNGFVDLLGGLINNTTGVFNNLLSGSVVVQESLNNHGEFNNQSTVYLSEGIDSATGLIVPSELNNSGVFNNDFEVRSVGASGMVINNAGEFNNMGLLEGASGDFILNNSGTFNNGQLGVFTTPINFGFDNTIINNTGIFNNYSNISSLNSNLDITNSGVINNELFINNFRSFRNLGVLNNNASFRVEAMQSMVNESSGVVNNSAGFNSYIMNDGTLDNRGTINNGVDSAIYLGNASVTNNTGTINNVGIINADGAINNAGVINNGDLPAGFGPEIRLSNTSVINNAGELNNSGDINGQGVINNAGTINNDLFIRSLREITSSGLIVNNGSIQTDFMEVSGTLTGQGGVTVGNGLVITEAGTLAPGNSTGFMSVFGGLNLNGTLAMEFDWMNTSGFLHDDMSVQGDLVLGVNSVLDISLLSDDFFALGQTYNLVYADTITGDFGSFYYDALFDPGLALEWSILDGVSQDILRLEVVSAVPLPASVWLFLTGLVGLISIKRKKQL